MDPELAISLEDWVKTLPSSRMIFPDSFADRLKYTIWRLYTPTHPFVRDALLALRIVRHEARQDCVLGKIAPDQTIQEFVSFLISKGFGNHFIAWKDPGEVVSLRYVEDFIFQYHVRVFEDGEVRGHYEYTPECHPIWHIIEVGQQDRRDDFLRILGDRIIESSANMK